MNRLSILTLVSVFLTLLYAASAEMVPFVIPADVHPDSEIAMSFQPLGQADRLSAEDHFYDTSGRRVRLWGVNLSFAACFPTHADAERIAKRMAAFGINSVRFHHMDTAGWPRGIWDKTGKDLHPEALDRLDYFINQLAQHGIYSNINLHVGKAHSQTLGLAKAPQKYDKVVNLFTPELIKAQKDYARRLLSRTNRYRDMTYAEDYAVAVVEITNENSLFMWNGEETLRNLPGYYENLLQGQYNRWLKDKYGSTDKLKAHWSAGAEPLGYTNLLTGSAWHIEQHGSAKVKVQADETVKIDIDRIDDVSWHLQYNYREIVFKEGQYYTVTFRAKASAGRSISVAVGQSHEPWKNLGLSRKVQLTEQWQALTMGFFANADDDNGRLNFTFGDSDIDFQLADIQLRTGGQVSLSPDETIEAGTVRLYADREVKARSVDRMVFLAETEKIYFDGMNKYIKQDLGCTAMVTGTIVFGPLGLYAQSDMDFIDAHAYWQHPHFPGKPWDRGNWRIEQKAMSDYPEEGTLYRLAAERLAGKPFTVSEYNHPAPLDSQAECVPMIASFAAAQDWDGLWLYTYSHSNDQWDREHLSSFFDIDTNPAKWGFVPAGAEVFRDFGLSPQNGIYGGYPGFAETGLDELASLHLKIDRDMLKMDNGILRRNIRFGGKPSTKVQMEWDTINRQGLYVIRNDRCTTLAGRTERFGNLQRPLSIQIDKPDYATVTVVALDQKPLIPESKKILITACGRCENTGMQFSEDRRTVGTHWGKAPVTIEPVVGVIWLPSLMSNVPMTCKVLKPDGTVKTTINIKNGLVPLKAEYGTMWYLVERVNP